ncbi:antibiotic biosynthesis monooxygenase [Acrocarpospora corrugata]|uniref:Antibiotic biosynthesis monooxygenase n=1 Tax=Acrocarpospora corrugata TaxID=35763 RepID=A0A5M3W0V5_9ACTN|nr:putative quinol monooxygenase [Acrocarpospora corrugata]GES02747.1 antibiotic biosynthesis monooxygenase [Acrocarpospora corrugata]
MSQLQVIAHYTVSPGNEDAVLALLPKLVEASRTEPGNISYVAYRALDDERRFVLIERYVSREAFAAHRESPHFIDLALGQIVPLLASRVVEVSDVDE